MTINTKALSQRLSVAGGVALSVYVGQVAQTGALPRWDAAEAVRVLGPALIGFWPAGKAPLGIVTPLTPGGKALLQTLAEVALAAWNAPRERRAAAAAAALEAHRAEIRQEAAAAVVDALNRSGVFQQTPGGLVETAPPAPTPEIRLEADKQRLTKTSTEPAALEAVPAPAGGAPAVPSWLVTNKEQTT